MTRTRWTTDDIPDQSGRVAVVTGGNSGLGLETCRALAGKGATVVLGCRTPAKGEAAREDILASHPEADVRVEHIDVASLDAVSKAAARILLDHPRIDLLVNNAGIMATPQGQTVDGFEQQLGTNHLGHFALTGLLLPGLRDAPGARVVHVSSLAARGGRMRWDDLMHTRGYRPLPVYNQSKLANQLFAYGLQRRLEAHGVDARSIAAHPGFAQTNLLTTTQGVQSLAGLIKPVIGMFWNDAAQGALPQLYAATAPDAQPGGYYGPDGWGERAGYPAPSFVPKAARSEADQDRLWEVSEALTGVSYLGQA